MAAKSVKPKKKKPRAPRRKLSQLERDHGHCADVLMSDYGIPREHRERVCEEVSKVWEERLLFHDLIIASVRGFRPDHRTGHLTQLLRSLGTHAPKNTKAEIFSKSSYEEW